MKFARVLDGKIYDICPGDPAEYYHPDVAQFYTEQVPDSTEVGATWDGHQWVNPVPPEPEPLPPALIPLIGPIAFQMLFTTEELIACDAAKATDAQVRIFWKLLDDPRADIVDRNIPTVQAAIRHLETAGYIGEGRAEFLINFSAA